ncbi:hypothetical protein F5B17DRAFT_408858 [Nemania serpens]|nr:hypothetical protein F5B17DRAFT_408858 [Nemania serpens]
MVVAPILARARCFISYCWLVCLTCRHIVSVLLARPHVICSTLPPTRNESCPGLARPWPTLYRRSLSVLTIEYISFSAFHFMDLHPNQE